MRPPFRLTLMLVVLMAWAAPARIGAGAEPALEGTYTAQGFNSDGSEYRGVVKIIRRGEGFLVAWFFPHPVGEELLLVMKSAGVGLMSGGMLAISYYGQDVTGVVLYQIENGGQRLAGRWASATGEGAVQTETLTKLPAPTAVPDTNAPAPPVQKKPIRVSMPRAVVATR